MMKTDHMYLYQDITQLKYTGNEEKSLHGGIVI